MSSIVYWIYEYRSENRDNAQAKWVNQKSIYIVFTEYLQHTYLSEWLMAVYWRRQLAVVFMVNASVVFKYITRQFGNAVEDEIRL